LCTSLGAYCESCGDICAFWFFNDAGIIGCLKLISRSWKYKCRLDLGLQY
jgi:hypothetical protein